MSLVMGLGTTLALSSAGENFLIWDTGDWDQKNWSGGSGVGDASLLVHGLFAFTMNDGSSVSIQDGPVVMLDTQAPLTMTNDIASVSPNGELIANFTASGSLFAVQFTDLSFVSSVGGSEVSWAWTFGDGGTSTLQNPSHNYGAAGPYTVTMTVTDTNSNTSTATLGILINPAGNLLFWDSVSTGLWDDFNWS